MKIVLMLIYFLSFQFLIAQQLDDHLVPENSIFNDFNFQFEYYSKVRNKLFNGLSDMPTIRYHRMPSFSGENVMDIYEVSDSTYEIAYHECEKFIWYNPDEKVVIYKFRKPISKSEVVLLKQLFQAAIDDTRYPKEREQGFDGTTYRFGYRAYGLRTGKIWSPRKGTNLYELVRISNEIIERVKVVKYEVLITDKMENDIVILTNKLLSK